MPYHAKPDRAAGALFLSAGDLGQNTSW